jgi:hypothetical protein
MKLHPSTSVKFTEYAESLCFITNSYMKQHPDSSIADMVKYLQKNCGIKLSEVSIRRYYYGVHHYNEYPRAYSQVRLGASFPINY